MKVVDFDNYGFVPDVIATSCSNSIKLEGLDFRVPCGKCLPCQKKRRSEWSLRLEHEYLHCDSALFITLTYNDISVPRTTEGYKTLYKKHVQDYIKRLRNDHVKYISQELKIPKKEVKNVSKPIRYYAVGEYGTKTRRPHYHMILFNYDSANIKPVTSQWKDTTTGFQLGHVDVGTVTGASINYVTKYMFKPFGNKDKRIKPFSLMSKKPIIGHAYLEKYGTYHIFNEILEVADKKGNKRRLPKAYLRRLFTNKEDRIQLSKQSFEKHKEQKIHKFTKELENYNDLIHYTKTKDADLHRHKEAINNKETL